VAVGVDFHNPSKDLDMCMLEGIHHMESHHQSRGLAVECSAALLL